MIKLASSNEVLLCLIFCLPIRWLRSGESTMGYLEVSIPTGMEADISSLITKATGGLFKRIEKAFRQVNLFFDWVSTFR